MTLRKLPDSEVWQERLCQSPEHNPPSHIVLEPGTWEHTCPACGKKLIFTIPAKFL